MVKHRIEQEKLNFLLEVIAAITVVPEKHVDTQQWCRKRLENRLKDSPAMLKMFEQDCRRADEGIVQGTSSNKIEAYWNYCFNKS